jgi:hypothetical protein
MLHSRLVSLPLADLILTFLESSATNQSSVSKVKGHDGSNSFYCPCTSEIEWFHQNVILDRSSEDTVLQGNRHASPINSNLLLLLPQALLTAPFHHLRVPYVLSFPKIDLTQPRILLQQTTPPPLFNIDY